MLGITRQAVMLRAKTWTSRKRAGRGGGHEWLLASMPEETRVAIRAAEEKNALAVCSSSEVVPLLSPATSSAILDDGRRYKALAKADLVHQYLTWQRKFGATTTQKQEFITAYTGGVWPKLLQELGPVSWKTLERWKLEQDRAGSVLALADNGEDNPFNELVKEIRAGVKNYSLHRTTLDDAIADGLYKIICKRANPPRPWTKEDEDAWRAGIIADYGDGADEELFCIPNRSSGAYLTTAMIEACMSEDVPLLTWTPPAPDFVDWPELVAATYTKGWFLEHVAPLLSRLPDDCAHFAGEDFGRSGDLSVFIPATETRDLRLVPPFVLELRDCPHRTQKQILFAILDALPRFGGISLDARGNGSALAEAARQTYGPELVREVMISEAWYRETMPKLKARFEDKTLLLPKRAEILSDFRLLRVVKGVARVPEKRTKDKTGGRHGDAAVAAAMLVDAREQLGSVEKWEYEGVGMGGMDFRGW